MEAIIELPELLTDRLKVIEDLHDGAHAVKPIEHKDLEIGKSYFYLCEPPLIMTVLHKGKNTITIEHKFGTEQIQLNNEN